MRLLPKNKAAALNDAEYYRYYASLSPADREKECRRTYIEVEYCVSEIDASGDAYDVQGFCVQANAEACFAKSDAVAVALEKRTNYRSGGDREIDDRDYTTLATRGDKEALYQWGGDEAVEV